MKKSITYVLLSVLFLCLCLPLGGCENNLEEYKDEKRTEITEYAEKKIAENGYTKEALQRIEKCVQEGKEKIIDGEKKKDVDTFVMETKGNIDAIENFRVKTFFCGSNNTYIMERFRKKFLDENRTYGMHYLNEDYDPEDSSSQQVLEDTSSPKCRTHIITEQSRLEEIYIEPPIIDWDKEMLVMFLFSTNSNRTIEVKGVCLDEKVLRFDLKYISLRTGSALTDTIRTVYVFKVDKIDVVSAELNVIYYPNKA